MKYVVLHADGAYSEIETDGYMELPQMQKIVGGYIEGVWVMMRKGRLAGKGILPVVNEEGLLQDLPSNVHIPRLAGPVLLVRPEHAEMAGLDDEQLEFVRSTYKNR